MKINYFELERYFARYEFSAPYLLSPSDCESLHMGELLLEASPESLELWQNLSLGYTESPGHPRLRAEIATLYTTLQVDDILVLAPEEGIFIAMHTLLSPGDEVVVISPAYQSLHEIAHSIGCLIIPWSLRSDGNHWQLDLNELERSLTAKTRLLVLNFPHNPSGYLPSRAVWDAIIALARKYDLYLFSDEMYRLLEYDPGSRLPAICDLYEKGISLSGMSKVFALPGLRIGWLATRAPGMIEHFLILKDYTTICNSAPSEILALIALQSREKILSRNREIISANLVYAEQFFTRYSKHFTWYSPIAGSVAFPKWNGPDRVEDFCREAVERQGVMIVPGSIIAAPGNNHLMNHFRVGLGRLNFPQALQRIEPLLQDR